MNRTLSIFLCTFIAIGVATAADNKPVKAPIVGYSDTPQLPSGWRVHDIDRPQPKVVTPAAKPGGAPSDAIILFDGTDLASWVGRKQENPKKKRYNAKGEALWKVANDYMEVTSTGGIRTRQKFGDCQLHIEWQTENPPRGDSQHRGNSGVFFMGRYEMQVLDCYENRTYADGSAGCIYGQTAPLVNACRKPGEWQVYDIIFQAPRFKDGKLVSPAYMTTFFNGVLVQHKTELLGPTTHKRLPKYKAHGAKESISLQDHGNPTRFRNIWIRELNLVESTGKKGE